MKYLERSLLWLERNRFAGCPPHLNLAREKSGPAPPRTTVSAGVTPEEDRGQSFDRGTEPSRGRRLQLCHLRQHIEVGAIGAGHHGLGGTTTGYALRNNSRGRDESPGQRARSLFAKEALRRIVPRTLVHLVSTTSSLPSASGVCRPWYRPQRVLPRACCARIAPISSGAEKNDRDGCILGDGHQSVCIGGWTIEPDRPGAGRRGRLWGRDRGEFELQCRRVDHAWSARTLLSAMTPPPPRVDVLDWSGPQFSQVGIARQLLSCELASCAWSFRRFACACFNCA